MHLGLQHNSDWNALPLYAQRFSDITAIVVKPHYSHHRLVFILFISSLDA